MNCKTKGTLSSPQQYQSPLLLTSHSACLMHTPLTLDPAACFLEVFKQSLTNSSLFPLLLFSHFINCSVLGFPLIYVIMAAVSIHLKPPSVQYSPKPRFALSSVLPQSCWDSPRLGLFTLQPGHVLPAGKALVQRVKTLTISA